MKLLAIDPGLSQSGVCYFRDGVPVRAHVLDNDKLLFDIGCLQSIDKIVIEMMSSYGMPVGQEVLETLVWIGRFMEAALGNECRDVYRIFRKDVKLHLCHSARAKDSNIWQAIVDRYGGKEKAVGKKATPGPLYGIQSHSRAALAVGLTFLDGVRSEGL